VTVVENALRARTDLDVPIPSARECKRLTNAKPNLARPNCRSALADVTIECDAV
jgi:hypothetical protein